MIFFFFFLSLINLLKHLCDSPQTGGDQSSDVLLWSQAILARWAVVEGRAISTRWLQGWIFIMLAGSCWEASGNWSESSKLQSRHFEVADGFLSWLWDIFGGVYYFKWGGSFANRWPSAEGHIQPNFWAITCLKVNIFNIIYLKRKTPVKTSSLARRFYLVCSVTSRHSAGK